MFIARVSPLRDQQPARIERVSSTADSNWGLRTHRAPGIERSHRQSLPDDLRKRYDTAKEMLPIWCAPEWQNL